MTTPAANFESSCSLRERGGGAFPDNDRRQYVANLTRLRQSKSRDPIFMQRPWECREAIIQLLAVGIEQLERSRQSPAHQVVIRIFTSTFPQAIYGPPLADKLSAFLALGGQIRVLVWNSSLGTNAQQLERLENNWPNRFSYRISGTAENGERLSHMTVVGKTAYRIEAPHRVFTEDELTDFSPEIPARACFNDREGAQVLTKYFDELWNILG